MSFLWTFRDIKEQGLQNAPMDWMWYFTILRPSWGSNISPLCKIFRSSTNICWFWRCQGGFLQMLRMKRSMWTIVVGGRGLEKHENPKRIGHQLSRLLVTILLEINKAKPVLMGQSECQKLMWQQCKNLVADKRDNYMVRTFELNSSTWP